MTLASRNRALTAAERRLLRARLASLETRMKRAPRVLAYGAVVIFLLAAMTFLASDAPGLVVTGFWTVVGAAILLWVFQGTRRERRGLHEIERACESALTMNQARVYDIRSTAFVEFEEVEDEGACYAFEIEDNRVVFVTGQQFYPEAKFPSLDFSLVYLLDEAGNVIDEHLEKRGPPAEAARTVPASVKLALEMPEHLEVLTGGIEDIEERLAPAPGSG